MKLKAFFKTNLPLAGVLIFLIALLIFFNAVSESSFKKRAAASAQAGGKWLLEYQEAFEDVAILWIMKNINDSYCRLPEFDGFLRYRFGEFENLPVDKFFIKFIEPNVIPGDIYAIDYQSLKSLWAYFSDLIIPALYCDVKEIPDDTLAKIFKIENTSGYNLSHRFLALILIRENGCLPEKTTEINEVMSRAAQMMAGEEGMDSFSDLYSERAAFLSFSGFKNLVKKEWLDEIMQSQSSDGGWATPDYFDGEDNPHTTALSVWALSQYSGACPFISGN